MEEYLSDASFSCSVLGAAGHVGKLTECHVPLPPGHGGVRLAEHRRTRPGRDVAASEGDVGPFPYLDGCYRCV
eukprot:CAMPEP_0113319658 /NCGR_PEP_ID=MMETSP0010_2-20120614/13772_1 /TAXON_ID=216773 ORGANISM="Corethron hystrix, Strain 308" /NCGR_SAMPLE_ID=MMETSP0010_2 /ASSEMBLY_ACC=CAM_ASM_000155 /LENGTH=72 /DNA_ID=CAMNT_0000177271 /DNA_START=70 /DNA_END=284 /DNA_ORIENTATION=- /assembly_acc=CAM_ASM_000155